MDRAEKTAPRRAFANAALADLDVLIDELTEVIDDENALLAEGMPGGAFPCGCRATLGSAVRQGDRANTVDPTACGTGAVDGVCCHGMLR